MRRDQPLPPGGSARLTPLGHLLCAWATWLRDNAPERTRGRGTRRRRRRTTRHASSGALVVLRDIPRSEWPMLPGIQTVIGPQWWGGCDNASERKRRESTRRRHRSCPGGGIVCNKRSTRQRIADAVRCMDCRDQWVISARGTQTDRIHDTRSLSAGLRVLAPVLLRRRFAANVSLLPL